jgi:hypothetical protein
MEEIFKRNLLGLRQGLKPQTFAEAILGPMPSFLSGRKRKISRPVQIQTPEFSEKKQVMESLERFAQEKTESLGSRIPIEGGEILVRPTPAWETRNFKSLDELQEVLGLSKSHQEIALKKKTPGEVRVLFVTEAFRSWESIQEDSADGFLKEVLLGFPLKTAEFFSRMITAMKLDSSEVILYPVEVEGEERPQDVMEVASFFKPEIMITLGAKASNLILKGNDRLNLIHGQFFQRSLGEKKQIQVVPLYHPSIIETNLNMKKTAWADMQKIMKHMKKLP